ncbi:single-stranded DNA-binding protein [Streptomyces sp. NPDC018347]|uniref:single-stranded DNA-binding protein n=1 Tax=Streptomyces sp. NPDC018347 TaxID=3157193 RepID=UPI0033C9FFFB
MNETIVCVVGNVATQPVYRESAAGPSARFRLAVTARYWDREKNAWTDGHTNFFTVWANRQLAVNVAACVEVGQPVVVQGRLKVRTETREGQQQWASADIDAVALGHDLSRGTALFQRAARPEGPLPTARPEPDWETPRPADPQETPADPQESTADPRDAPVHLQDTPVEPQDAPVHSPGGRARQQGRRKAVMT